MRKRTSNFELLRIIAMLLIIAGHFISQSGGGQKTTGINLFFSTVFGSASRVSVNLFLMIGVWFMVDAKFKAERVLKLYGETWIYSVVFTLIALIMGANVSILKSIINGFFPFIRGSLWYSTVYIELILLSPFLRRVFNWNNRELKLLLIILFGMIVCISTIRGYFDGILCALMYFIFIYLLIGYYKKYLIDKFIINKNLFLIFGVSLYLFMAIGKYISIYFGVSNYIAKLFPQYLSDYKSLPNFLIAICVFIYFQKLDIGSNIIVNTIAKSTFGIYIIHSVPAFYDFLWTEVFKSNIWINSRLYILETLVVIATVYISGMIIDTIRRKFIEPIWIKSIVYKKLDMYINKFYKCCYE